MVHEGFLRGRDGNSGPSSSVLTVTRYARLTFKLNSRCLKGRTTGGAERLLAKTCNRVLRAVSVSLSSNRFSGIGSNVLILQIRALNTEYKSGIQNRPTFNRDVCIHTMKSMVKFRQTRRAHRSGANKFSSKLLLSKGNPKSEIIDFSVSFRRQHHWGTDVYIQWLIKRYW